MGYGLLLSKLAPKYRAASEMKFAIQICEMLKYGRWAARVKSNSKYSFSIVTKKLYLDYYQDIPY
jgi:hypothetical protein